MDFCSENAFGFDGKYAGLYFNWSDFPLKENSLTGKFLEKLIDGTFKGYLLSKVLQCTATANFTLLEWI